MKPLIPEIFDLLFLPIVLPLNQMWRSWECRKWSPTQIVLDWHLAKCIETSMENVQSTGKAIICCQFCIRLHWSKVWCMSHEKDNVMINMARMLHKCAITEYFSLQQWVKFTQMTTEQLEQAKSEITDLEERLVSSLPEKPWKQLKDIKTTVKDVIK